MKVKQYQKTYVSNDRMVHMKTLQLEYEIRDVDLERANKLASDSLKKIQKERDRRLKQAIKEHDSFYIRRELSNVSSYELFKMVVSKFLNKYIPFKSK